MCTVIAFAEGWFNFNSESIVVDDRSSPCVRKSEYQILCQGKLSFILPSTKRIFKMNIFSSESSSAE